MCVRIAGPETARRLGIPVGSVVEGRRVLSDKDGNQLTKTGEDVMSLEDANIAATQIQGYIEGDN